MPALVVVGDGAEADALGAPPCGGATVAHLGGAAPAAPRDTRSVRRFKVAAFAAAACGAGAFGATLYLDNDVSLARPARLWDPLADMAAARAAVGAAVAPLACVPKGHAVPGVPGAYCERNSGVLYLDCAHHGATVRSIAARWRDAFAAAPTADGHDQAAFRAALYEFRGAALDLDERFNCRKAFQNVTASGDACVLKHRWASSRSPTAAEGWSPRGLANFFAAGRERADAAYRAAPAVFVHVPKCAGGSVKDAFVRRRKPPGAALAPAWLQARPRARGEAPLRTYELSIVQRPRWDRDDVQDRVPRDDPDPVGPRAAVENLYGSFAWGACGAAGFGARCAYYAMFRDPAARLLSEVRYCRRVDFKDQTCAGPRGKGQLRSANATAWARLKGDYVLEHFRRFEAPRDWVDVETGARIGSRAAEGDAWVTPVELRRRAAGAATADDLDRATRWLATDVAVVGLAARFEESLLLFGFVLGGAVVPEALTRTRSHAAPDRGDGDGADVLAAVRAAAPLDARFYAAAAALFDAQVAGARARCPAVPETAPLRACLAAAVAFDARVDDLAGLLSTFGSFEAMPPAQVRRLEADVFRAPLADAWASARAYYAGRDAAAVEGADGDARARADLTMRWHLGRARAGLASI